MIWSMTLALYNSHMVSDAELEWAVPEWDSHLTGHEMTEKNWDDRRVEESELMDGNGDMGWLCQDSVRCWWSGQSAPGDDRIFGLLHWAIIAEKSGHGNPQYRKMRKEDTAETATVGIQVRRMCSDRRAFTQWSITSGEIAVEERGCTRKLKKRWHSSRDLCEGTVFTRRKNGLLGGEKIWNYCDELDSERGRYASMVQNKESVLGLYVKGVVYSTVA